MQVYTFWLVMLLGRSARCHICLHEVSDPPVLSGVISVCSKYAKYCTQPSPTHAHWFLKPHRKCGEPGVVPFCKVHGHIQSS